MGGVTSVCSVCDEVDVLVAVTVSVSVMVAAVIEKVGLVTVSV